MTGPCPTCRHYVLQLDQLGRILRGPRRNARRRNRPVPQTLGYLDAGLRAEARLERHRQEEHRAAIRDLAAHLPHHAERRAP